MITDTLAFLAICLLVILLWQRKWWLAIADGMMWVFFGVYNMTEYVRGDVMWFAGLFSVFIGIIVFMSVWWMRPRHEPGPLEPSKRQVYEERLERELAPYRKKKSNNGFKIPPY